MIQFKLLGPVQLHVHGKIVDLGPPRQCSLMAALLVDSGRPLSIDTLIDRVWGDSPPAAARDAVYTYVARLRGLLTEATSGTGADPVQVHRGPGGYMLSTPPESVDLWHFMDLVDRARATDIDDPDRVERLSAGLNLWNGSAMTGLDSEWARRLSESLHRLKHEVTADWADAEIRRGNHSLVINRLHTTLLEDPLVEGLQERLIRAYFLNGETAQALRQYELARRLIADELGADPSPGMRDLHSRILRGDLPELDAPAYPPLTVRAESGGLRPRGLAVAPDTLPLAPLGFSGRDTELATLTGMLTDDPAPRPVLVTGGAGVGKTALVLQAADCLRDRFPEGLLYADLAEGPCTTPETVLGRLLTALGIPADAMPKSLAERVNLYRARLAHRRVLVILDNAATESQVIPLLPPGGVGTALITSRFALGLTTVRTFVLHELSRTQGLQMLVATVGRARVLPEWEDAGTVADHCSGIPLALRAVACRMTTRPHWTFAHMLARISDEQRRLEVVSYQALDMRASLDLTFDRLDPTAAGLFRELGRRIPAGTEFTAPALADLRVDQVEDVLDRLVDAYLLSEVGRDDADRTRYRMLDIHRIYAKTLGD
ncbi:BTAD domain-containing putative transcriptional regulator [Nocardia sp. NPDC059228]|uniref:AfsR/SARP family transcriptional regulator n=1 Tax=Nocardia sp. NPDC059228 TaxID=3346777 RepID=UPI0036838A8C